MAEGVRKETAVGAEGEGRSIPESERPQVILGRDGQPHQPVT